MIRPVQLSVARSLHAAKIEPQRSAYSWLVDDNYLGRRIASEGNVTRPVVVVGQLFRVLTPSRLRKDPRCPDRARMFRRIEER